MNIVKELREIATQVMEAYPDQAKRLSDIAEDIRKGRVTVTTDNRRPTQVKV